MTLKNIFLSAALLLSLTACGNTTTFKGKSLVLVMCNGQAFDPSSVTEVVVKDNIVTIGSKSEGNLTIVNGVCAFVNKE